MYPGMETLLSKKIVGDRSSESRRPSPLSVDTDARPEVDVADRPNRAARVLQAAVKSKGDLIVRRHQLRIMSFNSLKLRTGRTGLQEQWVAFAALLCEFDLVLMSEVPAKDVAMRCDGLVRLMTSCADSTVSTWTVHISEPSGPGNPEVHVAIARSPLVVVEQQTLHHVEGTAMDHAPFTLLVFDPRFERRKRLVVTHVHLPPSSRARSRDTQLQSLLRWYPLQSSLRLHAPFDPKAAAERDLDEVAHVICGDFNVHPSECVEGLPSCGWAPPLLSKHVSTSAGGKSYDNFIVDSHTLKACSCVADVMELAVPQNNRRGEVGLSDHDPIVLTLKEMPAAGRVRRRQVCVCRMRVDRAAATVMERITPGDFYRLGACALASRSQAIDQAVVPAVSETCPPPSHAHDTAAVATKGDDDAIAAVDGTVPGTQIEPCHRPTIDVTQFPMDVPVLCWDTETAGLSRPAICQLAYIHVTAQGVVTSYDKILKLPPNVRMSTDATKIHGITSARCGKEGECARTALNAFHELVSEVMSKGGVVLGHNIQFDCRAFNFTSMQWQMDPSIQLTTERMMDTMKKSTSRSPLKTKNNRQKPFKNEELCGPQRFEHVGGWLMCSCAPRTCDGNQTVGLDDSLVSQTKSSGADTPSGQSYTMRWTTSTSLS